MSKKIYIPTNNIRNHLVDLFHSFMSNSYKNRRNRIPMNLCSGIDYDDLEDEELLWLMHQQGYLINGIDDEYDDYANFYDDDDSDVIWPQKKGEKKGKKGSRTADDIYDEFWNREAKKSKRKHRKSKKARVIDITTPYSGFEDNPNDECDYVDYEEVQDDDGIYGGKEIYYYPNYHDKDNRLEFKTLMAFNEFCEENGYTVPENVASSIMFNRVSHTCLRSDAREYGLYEIMAESSYGNMFYEVCEASELD